LIHYDVSEDAVEQDELDIFLRRREEWDPIFDEDRPMPEVKPVGVPGAVTPLEMTSEPLRKKILAGSPRPSPLRGNKNIPVNKRTNELDVGNELGDHGLEGVKATRDELRALVEELGLAGDDAGDLVKSLSGLSILSKDAVVKVQSRNEEGQEGENRMLSQAAIDAEPAVIKPDNMDEATETGIGAVSAESASSEVKSEKS
jgi:hypothetical protein